MKRLLSIIGAITLVGTSTTSLIACNKPAKTDIPDGKYTPEELAKLKEENKLDSNSRNTRDNLVWMAPQEKPFNKLYDKWNNPYWCYFLIWRPDTNHLWTVTKFFNTKDLNIEFLKLGCWNYGSEIKENYTIYRVKKNDNYTLELYNEEKNEKNINLIKINSWSENNSDYFKGVYRWNLDVSEPYIQVSPDNNLYAWQS